MRRMRSTRWILVGVFLGAVAAMDASASDPGSLLETTLADGAYQTELPGRSAAAGDATRGRERETRETRRRSGGGGMLDSGVRALFGVLGPLVYALAWIALAVSVVLVVYFLARQTWSSRGRSARSAPPPSPVPPEAESPTGPAGDALLTWEEIEALAARGAFGDAVHRLFLLVLEQLRSRGRLALSSAVTGREAVHRARVPETSRQDLADLVSAVERFHFGDLELTRDDWERSREIRRRLLESGSTP